MKKICTKCGIEKDLEEFYNRKNAKDGKEFTCKVCKSLKAKKYYKSNKKLINEKHKKYKKLNKDKIEEYYELNKEARCEYQKKYNKLNKEEIGEYRKKYYELNKEAIAKYNKKYRQLNNEYYKEYQKEYNKSNKEVLRKQKKEYRQTLEGKASRAKCSHNRRTKQKNTINNLDAAQWALIQNLQDNKCIGLTCKQRSFKKVAPTRDHIVPVDDDGPFTLSNIQALCQSCNSKKGTKTIDYRSTQHKQIVEKI